MTALRWISSDDPPYDGLHALIAETAALGGAVGWLTVPPPDETRAWLDGVLAGGARLVVAEDAGQVVGTAHWRRYGPHVLSHNAQLSKLMTLPSARGRGIGRLVTGAVVEDARAAGIEVLSLDCRGNNHGALRLYAELGFVVTGRRPDFIAVGDERFDQVLLHLDLRTGPGGLSRHGGRREGPGRT